MDVLFAFTRNQVFQVIDREIVIIREVSSYVNGEEDVNLLLRTKL